MHNVLNRVPAEEKVPDEEKVHDDLHHTEGKDNKDAEALDNGITRTDDLIDKTPAAYDPIKVTHESTKKYQA